ncbi:UNKNOWN [Stylonychia lemnae]|uniref:Uncharacterized protein n=1 Tax=Stylonychia lemnae TaxID=5949 RepID=A0A078A3X6_STYLE|nr:UNKNOWN [Stylonychia lemnae]|eukprot:CDW75459.1 UNKNOWN [Stylonychia lemnae]
MSPRKNSNVTKSYKIKVLLKISSIILPPNIFVNNQIDAKKKQKRILIHKDWDVQCLLKKRLFEIQKTQLQRQILDIESSKQSFLPNFSVFGQNNRTLPSSRKDYKNNDFIQISLLKDFQSGFHSISQGDSQAFDSLSNEEGQQRQTDSVENINQDDIQSSNNQEDFIKDVQTILYQRIQDIREKESLDKKFDEEMQMIIQDAPQIDGNQQDDSIPMSLQRSQQDVEQIDGAQQNILLPSPPIGHGIDNSLNQNELRKLRSQQKPYDASNPSQQDLLDLLEKRTRTSNIYQQNQEPRCQNENQEMTNQSQLSNPESNHKPANGMHSPPNKLSQASINIDELQDQYQEWLQNMNQTTYLQYITWFNVNVKQINVNQEIENFFPPEHDFTIKLPEGANVVDRLRETAGRRIAQIEKLKEIKEQDQRDNSPTFLQEKESKKKEQEFTGLSNRVGDQIAKRPDQKAKKDVMEQLLGNQQQKVTVDFYRNPGLCQRFRDVKRMNREKSAESDNVRDNTVSGNTSANKKRLRPDSLVEQNRQYDKDRSYKKIRPNNEPAQDHALSSAEDKPKKQSNSSKVKRQFQ